MSRAINSHESEDMCDILHGVAQGSILGPLLQSVKKQYDLVKSFSIFLALKPSFFAHAFSLMVFFVIF